MTNSLLRVGDTGPEVAALQEALLELSFAIGAADGIFGPLTDEAVRGFQLVVGLDVDGIVGPLTRGDLSAGTWSELEPWYSAVRRIELTQKAEGHMVEAELDLEASCQVLLSDRYPTPRVNAAIDVVMSDLIAKARKRALRLDGATTYAVPNAIDLNAPSLASVTLKADEGPMPSGWVIALRVDVVTDRLLAPEDLFMPGVDFPAVLAPFAGPGDPQRIGPAYDNYDLLALRPDGIRVYWDPGHIKMEHAGIQHLDVPYAGLVGEVRPSIVARATPGFSVEAPAGPMLT